MSLERRMKKDRIKISRDLEKTDWEPVPSWFINEDKETFNLRNNTGKPI